MLNNLYVQQNGQYYVVYTPNGVMIAQIFLGNDGLFLLDARCMDAITKLLAKRWNVADKKN